MSPEPTWVPEPFGPRWLRNWLERHRNPFSFCVHLIGIPLAVAAVPVLILGYPWHALGLFVAGYALQFLGHWVEGNDVGEIIPFKKALGLPYVAISPRYAKLPAVSQSADPTASSGGA